jgi:hypothetical protein
VIFFYRIHREASQLFSADRSSMSLLDDHFTINDEEYMTIELLEDQWESVKAMLPRIFLSMYLDDTSIAVQVEALCEERSDVISMHLPDRPNIRSGEFGEILTSILLIEYHSGHRLLCIPKWKWKQSPNTPLPCTDVLLLMERDVNNPKAKLLVSAECKTKSTKNDKYRPIHNAIAGAEKDYKSRIAATLSWFNYRLRKSLSESGIDTETVKKIISLVEEYRYSVENGGVERSVNAVAILDKDIAKTELRLGWDDSTICKVVIISIKDLKKLLDAVYEGVPQC